jgi:peroxiredoxin
MATATRSISDQALKMQEAAAGRLPADVVEIFGNWTARLSAGGVPANVAEPGRTVSDVPLTDAHGVATSLHKVTAVNPAVLVFYRGAWCPYCNIALKTYGDQLLAPLSERGVGLVAISPQSPDGSLSAQETNALRFPVLTDAGNVLAGELGILAPARGADVKEAQERLGLDLAAVNADGTDELPMPTVVILDAHSVIRWIDVHPDYTTRSEVGDILAAIDRVL